MKSRTVFRMNLSISLWLLLVLAMPFGSMEAQRLAVTPALTTSILGTGVYATPSVASYTGPVSGYNPGSPSGASFDAVGNLYFYDGSLHVIASGKGPIAALLNPAQPNYVAAPQAGTIYPVAGNGTTTPSAGCTGSTKYGDGCYAPLAGMSSTADVWVDSRGNIFLADFYSYEIRVVYAGGTIPNLPASPEVGRIYAVAGTGATGSSGDGGPALSAGIAQAVSVYVDAAENVYIADYRNNAIRVVYSGQGNVINLPSNPQAGSIYTIVGTFGTACSNSSATSNPCGDNHPANEATLNGPYAVRMDAAGNIYISDQLDYRVRVVYAGGTLPGISNPIAGDIYTIAGTGLGYGGASGNGIPATTATAQPQGIAIDAAGNVYFANNASWLVQRIDANDMISTVVGGAATGTSGSPIICAAATTVDGDGCSANQVYLQQPYGVSFDQDGNLYVPASGSYQIHKTALSTTTLNFAEKIGFTNSQTVYLYNTSTQPLQLSSLSLTGNFSQIATGSTDCANSTALAPTASCTIEIGYTGTQVGTDSGTVTIASNSTNATDGTNTLQLLGVTSPQNSSTTFSISTPLINVGQNVTFTASVSGQVGSAYTPTGTVSFMNGTTVLGTATLGGDGVATLTTNSLAAGTYSVNASYNGDDHFGQSVTFVRLLTVSATPVPLITVTSSTTTVVRGASISFNVKVAPFSGSQIPTGTVNLQDGAAVLGSATLDASGNTSFTIGSLPVGANTIYASYAGDSTFMAALSNGLPVLVTQPTLAQLTPGIISTIATSGPKSVFVDASDNIYYATPSSGVYAIASGKGIIAGVPNPVAGTVYKLVGAACAKNVFPCGLGGVATATTAGIRFALDVKVDAASNVYIANSQFKIYRIDAQTDILTDVTPTPVAATATAPASTPTPGTSMQGGFFMDAAGNMYLPDFVKNVVYRVDSVSKVMTVVAGTYGTACTAATLPCGDGGAATDALLNGPERLYLDAQGDLFITDANDNAIRRVDGKTGIITTVVGTLLGVQCSAVLSPNCGDGGPATKAYLYSVQNVVGDAAGNLYIADSGNQAIRKVDTQGNIATIAGAVLSPTTGNSGDGGLATNATFNNPAGLALDSQGNLYIQDQNLVIRKVTGGTTALSYQAATAGSDGAQTVTLSNISNAPLNVTGLSFANGFVQQPSGDSNDCTGTETLAPGDFCRIAIAFFPDASGTASGSVNITDDSINAVSGQNVISVSGTSATGTQTNTITFASIADTVYGAAPLTLNATASSGNPVTFAITGPAKLAGSNTLIITGAGTVTVTAYQFGDNTYMPATPVSQTFHVAQAALTVTAASFSCSIGQLASCLAGNPLTYTITGFVNGDTQSTVGGSATLATIASATSGAGSYPVSFATKALTAANYSFTYVPGSITVTGNEIQNITFAPLANATYGVAPVSLTATSSSGLTVTYTVSGPAVVSGSLLSVTGAGVVSVTAQQAGNATYAAAAPVTQSFVVAKAALTVTANNQTMAQGTTPSNFTAIITGYVNGDPSSVVAGTPAFTTNASSTSPLGPQTLFVSQGTLAASNYTFTFVNGTITVVTGTAQTISFAPIPSLTYGVGPITLVANSTSGLPVSFSVTGSARLIGSTLNIVGAGTVTVVATQGGQGTYAAATPVTQSIAIAPAVLTIAANNASRVNNVPNPVFTTAITGFVNGDTSSVVGGTPALTTTATPGSPAGTYPINAATGSLSAANYVFSLVAGTLTITAGGPAPDFSITASPQVLTMAPGQTRQTTLTLTPINYFQGSVALSCGSLPANMSCVFSPAAFNADGTGTPVSVTLTVNTDGGSQIVGELSHRSTVSMAMMFWVPGSFAGLMLCLSRKRLNRTCAARHWMLMLLLLFSIVGGITACGGSSASTNSSYAAPGTSNIVITGSGSSTNLSSPTSHTLNLTVTVQGPQ